MKRATRTKLENAGWKVSDAREFLGLSKTEMRLIEVKLALARKAN